MPKKTGSLYSAAEKRRQSEPRGQAKKAREFNIDFEEMRLTTGLQTADRVRAGQRASDPGAASLADSERRKRARRRLDGADIH